MDRRRFIRNTALAGAALGLAGKLSSCEAMEQAPAYSGKRLVLVRLDGGNDGLHALFPREHDLIEAARPTLWQEAARNAQSIGEDWRLNGHLHPLLDAWSRQEMALLPFVGYDKPQTSHFQSSEIWDTGFLPEERTEFTGWLGRLMDQGKLTLPDNASPVLSLAGDDPLVAHGKGTQGFFWRDDSVLDFYGDDIRHWLQHAGEGALKERVFREYRLQQWLSDVEPVHGFPSTGLGDQLARVAAMIRRDKPFKVYYTSQGGYDTHTSSIPRLGKLFPDLAQSLAAFRKALLADGLWKDTLVFVYSEFGRTIDENASGGTDHGAAGLCILLGDNEIVRRYAALPWEIRFQQLAGEPYLLHQLDFRDLYRDFQEQWLLA